MRSTRLLKHRFDPFAGQSLRYRERRPPKGPSARGRLHPGGRSPVGGGLGLPHAEASPWRSQAEVDGRGGAGPQSGRREVRSQPPHSGCRMRCWRGVVRDSSEEYGTCWGVHSWDTAVMKALFAVLIVIAGALTSTAHACRADMAPGSGGSFRRTAKSAPSSRSAPTWT